MSLEIVITPGDIAGVGPEVMLKAWQEIKEESEARFLFAGPLPFWRETAEKLDLDLPEEEFCDETLLEAFPKEYKMGRVSAQCGNFAVKCVEAAARYCLAGEGRAMVTAPLNKEGVSLAGLKTVGHTDLLAKLTNSPDHAMAFYTPELKVVLVTHHQPLMSVAKSLTPEKVLQKIVQADKMTRGLGVEAPVVAVCGLNPHAGESGLLGSEDSEIIAPAVEDATIIGIDARGPLPSDTVFHFAREGRYDVVVAMYHDQGLIPVKLLAFERAVNVTLGLPFIRTSPDHGTAYDLAGKGEADYGSALEALRLAIRLA